MGNLVKSLDKAIEDIKNVLNVVTTLRDDFIPRWSNHDPESEKTWYSDIEAPNEKTYTRRYDLQAKKWASLVYNKDGTKDRVVYDDQRTDKET